MGGAMQITDNGGRRSGSDRRQLSNPIHFSDRRLLCDRRKELDRRSGLDRRSEKGFRKLIGMDRRRWFSKSEFNIF